MLKFKVGQKVKVIAKKADHELDIGKIYVVNTFNDPRYRLSKQDGKIPRSPWVYPSDIILV